MVDSPPTKTPSTPHVFTLVVLAIVAFGIYAGSRQQVIHRVHRILLTRLVEERPFVDDRQSRGEVAGRVIYILGGSHDSLLRKFTVASSLYRSGVACKILIMTDPSLTEYSPVLDRNLTNDEWAVMTLASVGVAKKDIDLVSIPSGYFGTLTEARGILSVAAMRKYRDLILVTSSYHTKRTLSAFSRSNIGHPIDLFIYGADEETGLGILLIESVKLIVYENLLLPAAGAAPMY
jgi:hypothetical protein